MKSLTRALLKFFKWALILAVTAGTLSFTYFAYTRHQELNYQTSGGWKFQDGWLSGGTQELTKTLDSGEKVVYLRRVYVRNQSEVVASIDPEIGFYAFAFFYVECDPDTVIETSQTYSSGESIELECDKNETTGDTYLITHAVWSDGSPDVEWSEDFDGYRVRENFGHSWVWDWEHVRQANTLNRAKKPEEKSDG